ncbi:EF-hand calcium-binding domain-containing protein 11-like isoform X2 [Branchiostoma floridae]|uniref:EF-hand calcium-binding domain-containing protein 11-like isoform X2 n=1 Tax=Branchiostoma floridae TaxID=7739 RepID=A0A9J7M6K5_BRAFL|nr:EF-hand calcium-binding domain-containing protein 11-like isoform X2 [Branchiostoma floridae]
MSASCFPFEQTIVAPPRGVTEQERRMIAAFEVDQVFKNATEVNGEHVLELDPFIKVMSSKMVAQDKDEEIRQVFLAFDTHCRGFLTLDDLLRACSQVAPHIPRHRMEAAFREVDSDGDSRVSYRDFEYMMKYSLDDRM